MVQVKLIRAPAQMIEGNINEWLQSLSRAPQFSFQIMDIKMYHIPEKDVDTVMIIYNQVLNQQSSNSQRVKQT